MSRGSRAEREGRATKSPAGFSHVRTALVLFVCGFVLASGAAAYGYWGVSASGSAESQVVSLVSPGTGTVGAPTSSSLTLSWGVSTDLPPGGGYVVLRSATSGGTYVAVASGTCSGTLTTVGCTDRGLNPDTAYFYEVKAVFGANWVSPPNAFFSGTTVAATGLGSRLVFATQPGGGSGGTAWSNQPVVKIEDASGHVVSSDDHAIMLVALSASNQASLLTCSLNPLNATGGTATFAGCKINLAGTYTLMAIDVADGLQATSAPLTICVGSPATLGFVQQPGGYSGPAPGTWSTANQPRVAIEDAGGNVVTGASSMIALTLNQNGNAGTLSGSTCTSAVPTTSGEAVFTNCTIGAFGENFTVTATGTGGFAGSTISQPFSIAGTPTHPAFQSQPAVMSNGDLSSIQVGVYDASNRLVTASSGGTVTLSSATGPAGGFLTCNASTAPAAPVSHGVATFTGCGVSASGSTAYTLTATTSSPALPTASVTSTPGFTVVSISAPSITFPTSTDPAVVKHNTSAVFAIIGTNFANGASFTTSGGFSLLSPVTWISSNVAVVDAVAGNGSAKGIWNLVMTNPDHGAATSPNSMENS